MVTTPTPRNRANQQISKVERFAEAIRLVKSGSSLARAARAFGVAVTSLHRRVNKKVAVGAKAGRKPLLSASDEEGIIEVIVYRSKRGMCMTDGELRILVREIASSKGITVPARFPSARWPARFVARHSQRLTRKKSQILDIKRYNMSTEERIRWYHANVQEAMKGLSPQQVWNCDKTGFCPQGRKPPRVVCPKRMHANVLRSSDRDNMSMMACISAAGDNVPPMFIFQGKRRQLDWMNGAVEDAVCTVTDSSNINDYLFSHWLKYFDDQLTKRNVPRPALLVLDGHFSHISARVLTYAVKHSIDIFVLPSHTSHFTQPLDNKPFSVLKRNYEKLLENFPLMTVRPQPTKHDLVSLVSNAWVGFNEPCGSRDEPKFYKGARDEEYCQAAFRKTGIFPLSLEVMLARIIGKDPSVKDLPAVNFAIGVPSLSDRQQRSLNRAGLSIDAVTAAFMGLKQLAQISPPEQTTKRQRTFVDGGVLMTLPNMVESVVKAENERRQKAAEKVMKAEERANIKKQKAEAAAVKKTMKVEERAKKKELKARATAAKKIIQDAKKAERAHKEANKAKTKQKPKPAQRVRMTSDQHKNRASSGQRVAGEGSATETATDTHTSELAPTLDLQREDARSLLLLAGTSVFEAVV